VFRVIQCVLKTGTTNDIRDQLDGRLHPFLRVGVWVGNNDNTPMSKVAPELPGGANLEQNYELWGL